MDTKRKNVFFERRYISNEIYDADSSDLIEFAKAYRSLGDAVADQLCSILDNPETEDVNPNALDLIKERIGGLNEEIDDALAAWEEYYNTGGDLEERL